MSSAQSTAHQLRILVVRPDRIGDVILSTPVFAALKKHYPKSHLTVLVRENVASLLRAHPDVDEVMVYDPSRKHRGLRGMKLLAAQFRKRKFKIALVLQSEWTIAAALFFSGVPFRVGPLSKLHSYLFYNRGIRQRRSHVEMHEADYNLQLLRRLGVRIPAWSIPTQVNVPEDQKQLALQWLKEKGWKGPGNPLIAIHPGMGGSALNWPENHYSELARQLLREGKSVLLTGSGKEAELLDRLIRQVYATGWSAGGSSALITYVQAEGEALTFLGALFFYAEVVVAPSTGPLHLAVAVGRPVVTFYPPIRVQSAIRWGPYVMQESTASILVPEVYCGEDFKCRGVLCNYYPCMKTLTVAQAQEEIQHQLAHARREESPPFSEKG